MRLNELALYRKGPFGSSLTKFMFVPKSETSIKVYEQKNAIQKDFSLGEYYISQEKFKSMTSFIVKPLDIIVSCAGTIGETYVLPSHAPMGIINQALMRISLFDMKICNFYLLYFDYILKKQAQLLSAGSAIKNIPPFEILKNMLMPIPPHREQEKIIKKINEVDFLINKYFKAQNQLLDIDRALNGQLKKSILQYAIQGKLVAQDPTDEPASELLKRIEAKKEQLIKEGKIKRDKNASIIFKGDDNKYYEKVGNEITCIDDELPFEIPIGWTWTTIGNLLQIQTGASFKKEEVNKNNVGIRILRGGNIISGSYVFKDDDIFINKNLVNESILLHKNDLITPSVTSIENVGKIARIIEDYDSVSAGGFVFILRPFLQNDIISQYLCFLIQTPIITDKIKSITKKSGSAFYNIGKERLSKIYIPLPPIEEQKRIVERIIKTNKGIED